MVVVTRVFEFPLSECPTSQYHRLICYQTTNGYPWLIMWGSQESIVFTHRKWAAFKMMNICPCRLCCALTRYYIKNMCLHYLCIQLIWKLFDQKWESTRKLWSEYVLILGWARWKGVLIVFTPAGERLVIGRSLFRSESVEKRVFILFLLGTPGTPLTYWHWS